MAQYHVKNGSHVAKAFKVRGGHRVVPAGKEADIVDAKELTEAQIEAFEREGVKVKAKGGKAKTGQPELDPTALRAVHHGGGRFDIVQGDEVLASGLSKADADAFSAMSEEEKAEYVKATKT
ncbi:MULTISPECIES: hypothetical protein [Chelativorans]|jgi:hypothetical protein|uniref:Uncharacterized protein n=1 Tax=Chelativorans sp. (strain BNC1) TaxID=266779 RepID=Q11J11_CHESB|nr:MULTISPECIES: hypothetical protein [Chelativorans]